MVCPLAESYISDSATNAGSAAEAAATRKAAKYADLERTHIFQPVAVENLGALPAIKSEATAIFAPQDGRWKITVSFDGRRFCVPKFRH